MVGKEIKIYTKRGCYYCKSLKTLLRKKKLKYEDISITKKNREDIMESLKGKLGSHNTVPIVFVGKKFIGGYDDMVTYLNKKESSKYKY